MLNFLLIQDKSFNYKEEVFMKTKFLLICALVLSLGSFQVLAEQGVGYVSVNEAVEKTGEQKRILKTLENERDKVQKIVRKKSEGLSKEAEKIRKEMGLLSENEKMKKYEELQKMQVTMEQFVKTKELEFQKKEADLRKQFMEQLKAVTASVAQTEKLKVIRNKDSVLWVDSKMDLTGKVVKAYKKKYKK